VHHIKQQNKILNNRQTQRIQIVAAHHPLKGYIFPIIQHQLRDGEHKIVIRLPNGHTQLIPARWTKQIAPTTETPLFSTTSLRKLIQLTAALSHHEQPEEHHEHTSTGRVVGDLQSPNTPTTDTGLDNLAATRDSESTVAPQRRNR
jgi:hypothetical protein